MHHKLFAILLITPVLLKAQTPYLGGNGNGFGTVSITGINLSITDSMYNGGMNDGFATNTALNISLSITDSLYNGGTGNGFDLQSSAGNSLSVADSLYNGGIGNGFHSIVITNVTLYTLDSLYNGGIGRGEIQLAASNINLGICSDTLTWNGNDNINWNNPNNWDCGTVPGINSIVIINAGKPRYPTIILNTEIKKLELRPGAIVTVLAGRVLILNGQ